MFLNGQKYPVAQAVLSFENSGGEAHTNIQRLRHAFFRRWLSAHDIRFFKPHAILYDLGGTANSRNFISSAPTSGECIDHSRWAPSKFIG
jgi:hypothetical protein